MQDSMFNLSQAVEMHGVIESIEWQIGPSVVDLIFIRCDVLEEIDIVRFELKGAVNPLIAQTVTKYQRRAVLLNIGHVVKEAPGYIGVSETVETFGRKGALEGRTVFETMLALEQQAFIKTFVL